LPYGTREGYSRCHGVQSPVCAVQGTQEQGTQERTHDHDHAAGGPTMMLRGVHGKGYRVRWREGTLLRQQTCRTHDEARRLQARKVLKARGGQGRRRPVERPNISVKDFAEEWLERKRSDVAPKTFASYHETVHRYILKEGTGIEALRVRDVEREDIAALLQQ